METKDRMPDAYVILGRANEFMEHTCNVIITEQSAGHTYNNDIIRRIAKENLLERVFKKEFGVDYDDAFKFRRVSMQKLKKDYKVVPVYFTFGEVLDDSE